MQFIMEMKTFYQGVLLLEKSVIQNFGKEVNLLLCLIKCILIFIKSVLHDPKYNASFNI
jgi:hypothetical protein